MILQTKPGYILYNGHTKMYHIRARISLFTE